MRGRPGSVHVIGAGLAGLAAGVALARQGHSVTVHEAARFAGGRCRSYFEPALGMRIDNGNHLLLSGNHAAVEFVTSLGAAATLSGPDKAAFPFHDLASGERWTVRPNDGLLPWWILHQNRRVPGTGVTQYLPFARLLAAPLVLPAATTIGQVMPCHGILYEGLFKPFLLAALNTDPVEASAALAGRVIRETLARGGAACRPLVAVDGLSTALIDPALAYLEHAGARVAFDHRLRAIETGGGRVTALDFAEGDQIELKPDDRIVLAVPAPIAALLLPNLTTPTAFRAIVNVHFKIEPPAGQPPVLGLVNATSEWLFAFPGRLSVTISGADRLIETDRAALAAQIWAEVAKVCALAGPLPPWQVIKERRATFAATPAEEKKRPGVRGAGLKNLVLAGDWTATGLPATIEGAIRSGNAAAAALD